MRVAVTMKVARSALQVSLPLGGRAGVRGTDLAVPTGIAGPPGTLPAKPSRTAAAMSSGSSGHGFGIVAKPPVVRPSNLTRG